MNLRLTPRSPRQRKWLAVAALLTSFIAMLVTAGDLVGYRSADGIWIELGAGYLAITWDLDNVSRYGEWTARGNNLGIFGVIPAVSRTGVWLPLWVLAVGSGVLAWRWRDRPVESGHCVCGYSLAGLPPGAPCPECGRGRIDEQLMDARHGG